MDTALITFMITTSASTQSVHLIGSWDNFSRHYPMERDVKRSRSQWRGCYTFEDIICDGDGGSSPKRTGGLKMGSTYYYYYELDNGTEHYDASIPFTTSCPYLPGQPVNLLYVPIEVQPLRYRSASMSSMANGDLKTMNPKDKFMSPRQPPPTPLLPRLNTSPAPYAHKRTARSVSPRVEKAWSPRSFFGLRAQLPSSLDHDGRGRSSSLSKMSDSSLNSSTASLPRSEELKKVKSIPQSRDISPQSFKRAPSREPSPLRHIVAQEGGGYNTTTLVIPDEITEEAEDDENFASDLTRASLHEKGMITQLSPPPSAFKSPLPTPRPMTDTSKPLPQLPNLQETLEAPLLPLPLRIGVPLPQAEMPRSHFSVSTISTYSTSSSTTVGSPAESTFDFSGTPSIDDDEDLTADMESGDEFTYSPVLEAGKGFHGYSLPEGDYASEQTLRKESPLSTLATTSSRTTFGVPPLTSSPSDANMTSLEELMHEMGYLGDIIVQK